MSFNAEDWQANQERQRRPCEKCTEHRPDSRGIDRCWNYLKVQAAGGIKLDFRDKKALKKKGGTWRGTKKPYWPFDYDPSLVTGGCPALVPMEPYCQSCAELYHVDNPTPAKKCAICGRDGNACENCGGVFLPDEFEWHGSYHDRIQLCKGCYRMLEDAMWGGTCQSCGQYHERTKTATVSYPWPISDEFYRLCPECLGLLQTIFRGEGPDTETEEQGDPIDEIQCANCEDWYPPDVMTLVDNDTWLCEHCMEECGFADEEGCMTEPPRLSQAIADHE
jgi:hypothetical protein